MYCTATVPRSRPPPPGGGGVTSIMYAYWVCAARETPIFSPEFPFRSISFSQITQKNPFRSITILHFLADFAVPETIIFKFSLISTRSSPPTAGSARMQSVRQRRGVLAVPEIRIFTLKTDQTSFRSPAFSSSKRLKLVPEPPHFHARPGARSGALAHFSLCRGTYLPKFG